SRPIIARLRRESRLNERITPRGNHQRLSQQNLPLADIRSAADITLSAPAIRRTGFMERGAGSAGSICLDACELHHLAPLLGFLGDQLAEVCGRDDKRRASKVGKPRLDLGIGEARVDLLVELVDDLHWRVFGYADAIPVARLIARHEL